MNNRWKRAFSHIHAEPELIAHTKEYLSQQVYQKKVPAGIRFRLFRHRALRAAVWAAVLAVVLLAGIRWVYFTPTAYISIDINPSLELGINRLDRIISVTAYNEEGQLLADSLNIRNMNYLDGLNQLLEEQTILTYLSRDGLMSLTIAGENETQSSSILQSVRTCVSGHRNIHCHGGDSEEITAAHTAGISLGKYQAFLRLQELDPSVTLEDVSGMTMREIQDLIDARSGDFSLTPQDTETSGSTNGSTESESSCESETWQEQHHSERNHHSRQNGHE